jgi:hypothetical protein
MKLRELILDALIGTHLFEMAFERKRVIQELSSLEYQINLHVLKIIVWPGAQDVTHSKTELTTWGNKLARMRLHMSKRLSPIGVALPWKHLYVEPFEHGEVEAVTFLLGDLQCDYPGQPITKSVPQIVEELTAFHKRFCQAIGKGLRVDGVVASL